MVVVMVLLLLLLLPVSFFILSSFAWPLCVSLLKHSHPNLFFRLLLEGKVHGAWAVSVAPLLNDPPALLTHHKVPSGT
jgi:hypothetical protein